MRVCKLKKLVLVWMLLWLPMAGALAAVMPLTPKMASAAVATSVSDMDVASVGAMPCHSGSDSSVPMKSCKHCILCDLAGALALGKMPLVPMLAPTHVYALTPPLAHPSFVPDPTAPPPRAALA